LRGWEWEEGGGVGGKGGGGGRGEKWPKPCMHIWIIKQKQSKKKKRKENLVSKLKCVIRVRYTVDIKDLYKHKNTKYLINNFNLITC
jgi:hypothetical protein